MSFAAGLDLSLSSSVSCFLVSSTPALLSFLSQKHWRVPVKLSEHETVQSEPGHGAEAGGAAAAAAAALTLLSLHNTDYNPEI